MKLFWFVSIPTSDGDSFKQLAKVTKKILAELGYESPRGLHRPWNDGTLVVQFEVEDDVSPSTLDGLMTIVLLKHQQLWHTIQAKLRTPAKIQVRFPWSFEARGGRQTTLMTFSQTYAVGNVPIFEPVGEVELIKEKT